MKNKETKPVLAIELIEQESQHISNRLADLELMVDAQQQLLEKIWNELRPNLDKKDE